MTVREDSFAMDFLQSGHRLPHDSGHGAGASGAKHGVNHEVAGVEFSAHQGQGVIVDVVVEGDTFVEGEVPFGVALESPSEGMDGDAGSPALQVACCRRTRRPRCYRGPEG